MNKLINSVQQDISLSDKANNYFTQALTYLEKNKPNEARRAAAKCLRLSNNIEQRLASRMLLMLSHCSKEETMKILNEAYSYSEMGGAK